MKFNKTLYRQYLVNNLYQKIKFVTRPSLYKLLEKSSKHNRKIELEYDCKINKIIQPLLVNSSQKSLKRVLFLLKLLKHQNAFK
jgi:hypothetical protein